MQASVRSSKSLSLKNPEFQPGCTVCVHSHDRVYNRVCVFLRVLSLASALEEI